jgi:hypothetical protein
MIPGGNPGKPLPGMPTMPITPTLPGKLQTGGPMQMDTVGSAGVTMPFDPNQGGMTHGMPVSDIEASPMNGGPVSAPMPFDPGRGMNTGMPMGQRPMPGAVGMMGQRRVPPMQGGFGRLMPKRAF